MHGYIDLLRLFQPKTKSAGHDFIGFYMKNIFTKKLTYSVCYL